MSTYFFVAMVVLVWGAFLVMVTYGTFDCWKHRFFGLAAVYVMLTLAVLCIGIAAALRWFGL